ncbi:MAG: tRNA (N6-threonylcarbamoyladenosine(37)-N6)-methyltransferase TrmO [Desulfobacteraceae bacterium]|nr:tRNA (N6-threonylcarbamoyladenosine(37)-N6)-methyltransferase TrmO [Desulfobacteraceae bacterium]
MNPPFQVNPIGTIHKKEEKIWLELDPRYSAGLLGIEGFSHIMVLYWFDRNDTPEGRATLQVHPRKNPRNPLTGVFATHAPVRPNPIALTVCRVLSVDGLRLYLEEIDALDESPLIDIKGYIPDQRNPTDIRLPQWVQHGNDQGH